MTAQTILPANTLSSESYDVANSLMFDDGSSPYLTKTVSSGDDMTAFTFSFWVKRSTLGATQRIISSDQTDSKDMYIRFESNDQFGMYHRRTDNDIVISGFQTAALFRDTSAWYHFVINMDSTDSTESDRIKMYVNGTRVTTFAGSVHYPTSGEYANFFNTNEKTDIGYYRTSTNEYFDGHLAEVVAIQGTAYQASDFGEFDEDSPTIWKPKDVSGLTFGTNGFYLDFEDSSALGNDAAGSNNFTVNNLTAIDQSTDTCTNNFATLNPLNANIGATVPTLSEGNLRTSNSITNKMQTQYSTIAPSTGKFYCEVKATAGSVFRIGISSYNSNQAQGSSDNQNRPGQFSEGWGYDKTGTIYKTESSIATYTAYNTGDIICIALDMTNKKLYFRRDNNAWENSANLATGSNGIDISSIPSGTGMAFGAGLEAGSVGAAYADFNFGSPPYAISSGNTDGNGYGNFEYAVPSGYYALNTKNLAEYG